MRCRIPQARLQAPYKGGSPTPLYYPLGRLCVKSKLVVWNLEPPNKGFHMNFTVIVL